MKTIIWLLNLILSPKKDYPYSSNKDMVRYGTIVLGIPKKRFESYKKYRHRLIDAIKKPPSNIIPEQPTKF